MFLMNFDTKHHSFSAVGLSVEQLSQSLLDFWAAHSAKTGASPSYAKDCLEDGCVTFTPIGFNQIVMDGHSDSDGVTCVPLQLTKFTLGAATTMQTTEHWLSITQISSVVSHAQKLALAEMAYATQRVSESELSVVKAELFDALGCLK